MPVLVVLLCAFYLVLAPVVSGQMPSASYANGFGNQNVGDDQTINSDIDMGSTGTEGVEQDIMQGQISSSPSVLPARVGAQTAMILFPRADDVMYSGVLTYHATRDVQPVVWTIVDLLNATAVTIPEEFGDTEDDIHPLIDLETNRTAQVVTAAIGESGTSGSISFVGDAIELVGDEEDDLFVVSYSVVATAANPVIINDLVSFINSSANNAG